MTQNQYTTITGFAWVLDENGLSDKTPVGEYGKLDTMIETLRFYAESSIRCEFVVTITD